MNLDVRTITIGISLLDCVGTTLEEVKENIYNKITTVAKDLVSTGKDIEKEFGIPIVNKRISITPVSLVGAAACKTPEDYVTIARTLDRAAEKVGVNFIGGYSALVSKGMTPSEENLIRSIPQALAETERIALGLRTLTPTQVTLAPSRAAGGRDGLSVEGLCCRYKREPPIFQNLSFSARPGEVLAVTGDNGVGKSTLSRCLCGLMRESAGTIRLNGRILGPKQRQRIAYCVMQDVNHQLFSDSVWGECRLAMEGLSDQRIQEVLDRLNLLAFREKHPMALSGGQKQRLAVATAMLSQKPLPVFDFSFI